MAISKLCSISWFVGNVRIVLSDMYNPWFLVLFCKVRFCGLTKVCLLVVL
jgi:hypothetical protein